MSLFVIIGPQAVGKMTVGKKLEEKIDAKLLFNHQTIDLFATYLGYNHYSFDLSDRTRKELFQAFVANKGHNPTASIIFTVLIAFDLKEDVAFLQEISRIFLNAKESVYFIELEANLETRLKRNVEESRLLAKPSKRDIIFSKSELLDTHKQHRLNSFPNEIQQQFPDVNYLHINNTELSSGEVVEKILEKWQNL